MRIRMMLLFALFVAAAPAYAYDVKVTVAEVKDTRSTGDFFNNLEIKLKLLGDDAPAVRGIRTTITSAVDDTGRNLLLEDENKGRFEAVGDGGKGRAEVELKFRNPARKASVVKKIAGELELFMPDKDPAATVIIKGFMKSPGKPIDNAALKKAGITVTVLTKKEYEVLKQEKERKAKADVRKQGLTDAMLSAFEGLLSGFFQVGDNDLLFKISDPSGNLVDMDVVDARGGKIKSRGIMTSGDLRVLNYGEPVPADAGLKMLLKTEKSVVLIPLRLVDVALP